MITKELEDYVKWKQSGGERLGPPRPLTGLPVNSQQTENNRIPPAQKHSQGSEVARRRKTDLDIVKSTFWAVVLLTLGKPSNNHILPSMT